MQSDRGSYLCAFTMLVKQETGKVKKSEKIQSTSCLTWNRIQNKFLHLHFFAYCHLLSAQKELYYAFDDMHFNGYRTVLLLTL